MWWKTLKSDQSDLFTHTLTLNGDTVLSYLRVFLPLLEHNDSVTSAECSFNNPLFLPSSVPASAPLVPLLKQLKHDGGAPQAWPLHPYPQGQVIRSHLVPPPHIPLFHTRHAEESAERPHLVTIVRPCGQSAPRKVSTCLALEPLTIHRLRSSNWWLLDLLLAIFLGFVILHQPVLLALFKLAAHCWLSSWSKEIQRQRHQSNPNVLLINNS